MTDKSNNQKEIVIRSQEELSKLLGDNYNDETGVVFIDKDLRLDWDHDSAYFEFSGMRRLFICDVKCKNIDAGSMSIVSKSKITAHDITASEIKCKCIHANNIDCGYLQAKSVWANSTTAKGICSNAVYVLNIPFFCSYDHGGK